MENTGATDKLYDLTTIYAISDNNPSFLEKLLLVFTDTVKQDVTAMQAAAAESNWPEVGQLAHKIKPSLSHFGITSLKDVIRDLEHNAGSSPQKLTELVNEVNNVMSKVILGLRKEFPNVFI